MPGPRGVRSRACGDGGSPSGRSACTSAWCSIVVACGVAAWWQVTRALSGNGLSWFYSLEWPAFALLAIAGWWHLIHEDPEHFRARKQRGHEWETLEDPYRSVR